MFSQNNYFPTYTRTSIIYLGCITFCIITLGAIPYLKTDVSVRSSALIRPASEVNVIRCISSGKIKETYAAENKKVKAGELLYVIDSETLNEQEKFFQEKISLKKSLTKDVELVIEASKTPSATKPIFNSAGALMVSSKVTLFLVASFR